MMKDPSPRLIKVWFEVDTGDGPLPKLQTESVWAEQLSLHTARLRNVPFFACGVALGDVVEIKSLNDDVGEFIDVIRPADACTVHAFMSGETSRDEVIARLVEVGCTVEIGPIPTYLAIHVPSAIAAQAMVRIKSDCEENGSGEFQVSCSRMEDILSADV